MGDVGHVGDGDHEPRGDLERGAENLGAYELGHCEEGALVAWRRFWESGGGGEDDDEAKATFTLSRWLAARLGVDEGEGGAECWLGQGGVGRHCPKDDGGVGDVEKQRE